MLGHLDVIVKETVTGVTKMLSERTTLGAAGDAGHSTSSSRNPTLSVTWK